MAGQMAILDLKFTLTNREPHFNADSRKDYLMAIVCNQKSPGGDGRSLGDNILSSPDGRKDGTDAALGILKLTNQRGVTLLIVTGTESFSHSRRFGHPSVTNILRFPIGHIGPINFGLSIDAPRPR